MNHYPAGENYPIKGRYLFAVIVAIAGLGVLLAEIPSPRYEFQTKCAEAKGRVFESEGRKSQWACIKDNQVLFNRE